MSKVDDVVNNASAIPESDETKDEKIEEKIEDSELKGKEEEKKDDGPGVVAKLMKKLGVGKVDDEPGESDDEDIESEDIPDEFTEVALKNGWTESDIIEFAVDHSNDELIEMIPFLSAEDETVSEEDAQKAAAKKEQETGDKKSEAGSKDESEAVEKLREEFQKEIADLKKDREKQSQAAMVETVDKAFDEANEKFGVFGKTDELPKFPAGPKKGQFIPTSPAYKARSEVIEIAYKLMQAGTPVKDAMSNALTWYKGKHLDKDVERKYIEKLKRNEKKLSAKRQGKETQKTYENEEDRGADVVRGLARKAGVTLEE